MGGVRYISVRDIAVESIHGRFEPVFPNTTPRYSLPLASRSDRLILSVFFFSNTTPRYYPPLAPLSDLLILDFERRKWNLKKLGQKIADMQSKYRLLLLEQASVMGHSLILLPIAAVSMLIFFEQEGVASFPESIPSAPQNSASTRF